MPTTRRRHTITETDKVTTALRKSIEEQEQNARESHRAAVLRTSGAFTGVYSDNYLAELREDWSE